MEIRTVTEDDAAALCEYASALFDESLPGIFKRPVPTLQEEVDYIRTHLEPANATLLVAVDDGAMVGLAGLVGGTVDEEKHAATLGVSVSSRHRGQGVGTALIEALLEWAPSVGISRVQLWAWANNPGAIRLYSRLGFDHEGVARRAVVSQGQAVDVVLMARLLAD